MAAKRKNGIRVAEGSILAVLILLLTSLAVTTCGPKDKAVAHRRGLSLFQESISFEQVPIGATEDKHFLTVVNNGSQTVTLQGAKADSPFSILFERPLSVEPGAFIGLEVVFKPQAEGPCSGQITITADNGQTLTASVSGKGIPYKETGPEHWAKVQLSQDSFIVSEGASQFNGTLIVSSGPGIPHALRNAVFKLDVQGVEGAGELSMNSTQSDLLFAQPIGFRIKFKPGSAPPPIELVGKAILVDEDGKEVFTYSSPPLVPEQEPPPQGAPPACGCLPTPTPPPVVLATSSTYFPDSPIPPGDGPGATAAKVAEVKVSIKGPGIDTCCKPPTNFEFNLQIASDFGLPGGGTASSDNTAHQIIRACRGVSGLTITASTNGVAHAFTSAPGSAFACPELAGGPALPAPGTPIGNIILQTTFLEPIICVENAQCPCVLGTSVHETMISYGGGPYGLGLSVGGAGNGHIGISWNVTLAGGAADCITGAATATITRVLFARFADVYDPARHSLGWLYAYADPDGDGRNNVAELRSGTDPNVAD